VKRSAGAAAFLGLAFGAVAGLLWPTDPPAVARSGGVTRFGQVARSLSQEERERSVERKIGALEHPVRDRQLPPDVILRALDIQPGMTVVDIGAGTGRLSLPIARALNGRGRVFATDVDDRLVPVLRDRAAAQGLEVLQAVHVQPGFDPFYRDKQFDRVVMCSVFEYLQSPSAFFEALRPSLRPGSGRLAILQGHTRARYFPTDFDGTFRRAPLLAQGDGSPVLRRMPPNLRAHLRRVPVDLPVDATLAADLAVAFERMLADPLLVSDLLWHDDPALGLGRTWLRSIAADDRALLAWIHVHFDDTHLWQGPSQPQTQAEREAVRTAVWTALSPYFSDTLPREIFARGIYLSPAGIVRRMQAAGYRLDSTVQALEGHDFLLFSRAAN